MNGRNNIRRRRTFLLTAVMKKYYDPDVRCEVLYVSPESRRL